MGSTRITLFNQVRFTRGSGGQIVAARECRRTRSDKGLPRGHTDDGLGTRQSTPPPKEHEATSGGAHSGQTGVKRSKRSRKAQFNTLLDHFPGYVLAHALGGFRFVSLRTLPGMTVKQGHQALVHLRTGLAKRYRYVAELVLQPDFFDESLIYVRGKGWHADYSLEASDDGSTHFHIMMAIFGYDPAEFVATICKLWEYELTKFLNRSGALGPYYIHVGDHLGPETVQYMVGHKRTRRGRDAHDFSEWLGEGESLGTDWYGVMGGPCRALVKGNGEFLDQESVEALKARAIAIDQVKWGGRDVPETLAHFQDRATGTRFYVVSGPWLGSAARYLATGSLRDLAEYRRALLRSRHRRRNRLRSTGATSAQRYRGIR